MPRAIHALLALTLIAELALATQLRQNGPICVNRGASANAGCDLVDNPQRPFEAGAAGTLLIWVLFAARNRRQRP